MIEGLVSCIIPTYKRCSLLRNAVQSVLAQTYSNIEVIVVDDNEPNDYYSIQVQDILSTFNDTRLKYIQQERHVNGAAARNKGIQEAKGEYIAFLDDDDEWLEDKLEKQLMYLDKFDDSYSAVTCLANIVSKGKIIRKTAPYKGGNLHRDIIDRTVSIYTPTIVLKRCELDAAGHFDESLVRHQDVQLFLDFSLFNKIAVLNEHLVNINVDNTSNAPNSERLIEIKEHFFKVIQSHLEQYDLKEQRRIKAAHNFEIVFIALREHKIGIAIRYLFKIGFNISSYIDLMKRVRGRRNKTSYY
jgi:glycosyltransferase involved in cell wall biosynthesis